MNIWEAMGFIRWPMSVSTLLVVVIGIWSAIQLSTTSGASSMRTKVWIDSVLFWGGFTTIAGVLGTLVGIVIAAQSIEAAGTISTPLVWGGIKVALLSAVFGILVLACSSLLWFGLNTRWRLNRADEVD